VTHPLLTAVQANDHQAALALAASAPPWQVNQAMYEATRLGDAEALAGLMAFHTPLPGREGRLSMNYVLSATSHGHLDCVQLLLPHISGTVGQEVLNRAARAEHWDIVRAVVPVAMTQECWLPPEVVGDRALVELFFQHGQPLISGDALWEAASNPYPEVFEFMLSKMDPLDAYVRLAQHRSTADKTAVLSECRARMTPEQSAGLALWQAAKLGHDAKVRDLAASCTHPQVHGWALAVAVPHLSTVHALLPYIRSPLSVVPALKQTAVTRDQACFNALAPHADPVVALQEMMPFLRTRRDFTESSITLLLGRVPETWDALQVLFPLAQADCPDMVKLLLPHATPLVCGKALWAAGRLEDPACFDVLLPHASTPEAFWKAVSMCSVPHFKDSPEIRHQWQRALARLAPLVEPAMCLDAQLHLPPHYQACMQPYATKHALERQHATIAPPKTPSRRSRV
jgi:hypothetical protein